MPQFTVELWLYRIGMQINQGKKCCRRAGEASLSEVSIVQEVVESWPFYLWMMLVSWPDIVHGQDGWLFQGKGINLSHI